MSLDQLPDLLSGTEALAALRVSKNMGATLFHYPASPDEPTPPGKVRATHVGPKIIRVRKRDLLAFLGATGGQHDHGSIDSNVVSLPRREVARWLSLHSTPAA